VDCIDSKLDFRRFIDAFDEVGSQIPTQYETPSIKQLAEFRQIEIEELDCKRSNDSIIPKVCCSLPFAREGKKSPTSEHIISTTPACNRMH
jgi:hypothetical protein